MTALDPRTIVAIMGGVVTGRESCNVPGPGHSPKDTSLSVRIDPADPLGFKVHSFADDDWRACRDHVAAALGQVSVQSAPKPQKSRTAGSSPVRLFYEAVNAKGTIVETHYLVSRRLELPDRHEEVLRFHPNCPFTPGKRFPCMVALFRDIRTNEPRAIHRTALTADGQIIDRMSLGTKAGCAIKLTPDENVTEGLTVGEGIETTLAGMALNFRPAWALGDAGEVRKFPVLSGIECLTILVDNDARGTGQASALECSHRWTSAGREVFRVVPTTVGADMADIVGGRAA